MTDTVRTDAGPDTRHAGLLDRVYANFRQYLTGWGEQVRATGITDHFRSGLAQPQFNGVVRLRRPAEAGEAVTAAGEALAGVPWWWWVGQDSPVGTREALTRHGMTELGSLPVMARSLDRLGPAPRTPEGVRIVPEAGPGLLAEVVRVYSRSMGAVPGIEPDLARIEARRADNGVIDRLAALDEGRVIGTATVISAYGVAGIFLVHVAEEYRRRGIGEALTDAALRAGRDRGMRHAALVASPAGEPLYRRLEFTTVSEYHLFAPPAP
ncbi:GNAT family N-acetyltransferase [Streptomyces sp. NPDC052492]|uniref:GNAT family N-acetyltransferase n=1 Tax=unclassified Streptomyces TaxID=2593676 RepID=UPI0037D94AD8